MKRYIIFILFSIIFSIAQGGVDIPQKFKSGQKALKAQKYKIENYSRYLGSLGIFIISEKDKEGYGAADTNGNVIIPVGVLKSIYVGSYHIGENYFIEDDPYSSEYPHSIFNLKGELVGELPEEIKEKERISLYGREYIMLNKTLYDDNFKPLFKPKGELLPLTCAGVNYIVDSEVGLFDLSWNLILKKKYLGPQIGNRAERNYWGGKACSPEEWKECSVLRSEEDIHFRTFWRPDGNGGFEAFLSKELSPGRAYIVKFAGKNLLYLDNYLFYPDGTLFFDKQVSVIYKHALTVKVEGDNRQLYNKNLEPISRIWSVIYQNDGCEYFIAKDDDKEAAIIDMTGKEYPIKYYQSDLHLKMIGNNLCQDSKPIKGATRQALLAAEEAAKAATSTGPVTKDFPSLEFVAGSLAFVDPAGRNAIEANGEYNIEFEVKNVGNGTARNCRTIIKTDSPGITLTLPKAFDLAPGKSRRVSATLTAGMDIADGQTRFNITVDEGSGFGTSPSLLDVVTHAFEAPDVRVNDYTISSASGSTLQRKQPFDLAVLVQNMKHGKADDVTVRLTVPQNVLIIEGEANTTLGKLDGGASKELSYSLLVNNNYSSTTIPIKVNISEKYGKYAESRTLTLTIDQPLAATKVSVAESGTPSRGDIVAARLNSDVDTDIPKGKASSPNTFAVIIANETYSNVATVPFALNDGAIFEQYCLNTLGIPERNIRRVTNATLNDMRRQVAWLGEVGEAFGSDANIIFYYSGHGIPDEKNGDAYIVPVDGYHSDMNTNLPVTELYKNLDAIPARRVTVFMDACFSGARRGNGMLMAARGVVLKSKAAAPANKMVVFSAAKGDETAYPYSDQHHGLFTYYLLKKLQSTKGEVTLGELGDYITDQVKKTSILENSKSQTPQVLTAPSLSLTWRDMAL